MKGESVYGVQQEQEPNNRINGKGGVTLVHLSTKIFRPTIYAGIKEIEKEEQLEKGENRKQGGGKVKNNPEKT